VTQDKISELDTAKWLMAVMMRSHASGKKMLVSETDTLASVYYDYDMQPDPTLTGLRAVEVIGKVVKGEKLEDNEIREFIRRSRIEDENDPQRITDYQLAAFEMAVSMRNLPFKPPELTPNEIADLTMAMAHSGEVLDLSFLGKKICDKHSSGGVGYKTTLVVAPLVAAASDKVVMGKMAGPGLGHTGGTIDKLLSIPGFRVDLSKEEFIAAIKETGIVVTGQSHDLAPADGKLYAMRDVTGTVASIPLIAASIMSKKLAAGADVIVLDVTCGKGAFMETLDDARELARTMVDIGKSAGKKVVAEITQMDEPRGQAVGNAIEVEEAIDILKGLQNYYDPRRKLNSFVEHCITTAARIIYLAGVTETENQARELVLKKAQEKEGGALDKFKDMVRVQNGDISIFDNPHIKLGVGKERVVEAPRDGYIKAMNPKDIGIAVMKMGGGRAKKGDPIDYSVGAWFEYKVGDKVNKGDTIAWVFANDDKDALAQTAVKEITDAIIITDEQVEPLQTELDFIS
jgi:pyrimidine-nucleoside phosphorylase